MMDERARLGNLTFERAVAEAFDLGMPVARASAVEGGLTHRMWRLTTDRGAFAVKELSINAESAWTPERIERSFALEMAAFEAGVSMPRPIRVPGASGCLADVVSNNGTATTVRVHAWVDGTPLQRAVYGADVAGRVGGVIAQIHRLAMAQSVDEAWLVPRGDEHWRALAQRVERSDAVWKWEFRAILPTLAEIEAYAADARHDGTTVIMSHRDADQKNWLRTADGTMFLLDWDAAGPVNPRHEVASLALTWAGAHLGEPDWKVVRAWITGYRGAGGPAGRIRDGDLAEFLTVLAGWFEYNTRRVIGDVAANDAERARSSDIVRRHFRELPRYVRSIERWTQLLASE